MAEIDNFRLAFKKSIKETAVARASVDKNWIDTDDYWQSRTQEERDRFSVALNNYLDLRRKLFPPVPLWRRWLTKLTFWIRSFKR